MDGFPRRCPALLDVLCRLINRVQGAQTTVAEPLVLGRTLKGPSETLAVRGAFPPSHAIFGREASGDRECRSSGRRPPALRYPTDDGGWGTTTQLATSVPAARPRLGIWAQPLACV
jgi:hypothetical protein